MSSLFKTIFDKSVSGIVVFGPDLKQCVHMNDTAREVLGVHVPADGTPEVPLTFEQLIPPGVRHGKVGMSDKLAKVEGFYPEVVVRKADGQLIYAEVGIRMIGEDGAQDHYLVMVRDITYHLKLKREVSNKQEEMEKAFNEILTQNKELKALDKAKDGFIALTSHELRTPLSAIVATAEVLELKMYDTAEEQAAFIHTIFDQGKYLLTIVNDILDFSKIQAGKLDLFVQQEDPHELMGKVAELFENFGAEKGVTVEIEKATEDNLCYFDSLRLKQVINNLLSNAIKFTHANTKVILRVKTVEEHTIVSVIDAGPGIPPENLDKIFNEFETLQNIDTHHKGTGLGLPISRRLVQLQGGQLTVESEVGKGASFNVMIPRTKVLPEEQYKGRDEIDLEDLAA